jgi:hypothetical protein
MRFTQRSIIATAAATFAMIVWGGALAMARGYGEVPMASSYNGSWPVTVTHSQHSNWTGCLTLTRNASGSSASLIVGSQKFPSGSFLITNGILVATIQAEGYGQNAGLVFIAPAHGGDIGRGVYEDVYGGSDFDSGDLAFGTKNGC